MLYHHDNRPYALAAEAAATEARKRMEKMIEGGRGSLQTVFERVAGEIPSDMVVPVPALDFFPDENRLGLTVKDRNIIHDLDIHPTALVQVAQKAHMSKDYVDELLGVREPWATTLLAHNLNELFHRRQNDKKVLIREVNDQVRGFLSNKFRRMDSTAIVEAFLADAKRLGLVGVEGHHWDVKWVIKAVLPVIFEPVPNELFLLGVALQNSDFGHGALSLSSFIVRLWCTNMAIAEDYLRQVHLGRRLSEDVEFSEETYRLDTQAMVSALHDIINMSVGPDKTTWICDSIKAANEEKVDARSVKELLKKFAVGKEETTKVIEAFASADIENLPPGQTKLRLSNALSWVAGDTEDEARRVALQEIAGQILLPKAA